MRLGSLGSLGREFGIVIAGRVLLAILSLVYLRVVLLMLGAADFGLYTFIFSTASFLSMLMFAAVNVPTTRVSAANLDDTHLPPAILTLAIYVAVPTVLSAAVVAAATFVASQNITLHQALAMALPVGLIATSAGIVGLFSTFLLGQRRRVANLAISNGVIAVRLIALGVLYAVSLASASAVIWAIALAGSLFAALASRVLDWTGRWCEFQPMYRKLVDLGLARQYLQNWPVAVGSNLLLHGDKIVLSFVLPIELIGLLAIYQQFARMLANLSIGAVYQFSSPFLLRKGAPKAPRAIAASLASMVIYIGLAGLALGVIPLVNTHYLEDVLVLDGFEFMLVCVAVALTQSGRIIELNFFTTDRISFLIMPLMLSAGLFLVAGPIWGAEHALIGAIWALVAAAAFRYACTMVLLLFRGAGE